MSSPCVYRACSGAGIEQVALAILGSCHARQLFAKGALPVLQVVAELLCCWRRASIR